MTFQKAIPMTNASKESACFIKHWCTFIMKVKSGFNGICEM